MFEAFNCFGLYLQVTFANGRWAWLHHAGNVRFAGKGSIHVSTVPLNGIVMVLGQPVHREVFHHVHSGAVTSLRGSVLATVGFYRGGQPLIAFAYVETLVNA